MIASNVLPASGSSAFDSKSTSHSVTIAGSETSAALRLASFSPSMSANTTGRPRLRRYRPFRPEPQARSRTPCEISSALSSVICLTSNADASKFKWVTDKRIMGCQGRSTDGANISESPAAYNRHAARAQTKLDMAQTATFINQPGSDEDRVRIRPVKRSVIHRATKRWRFRFR